MKKILLGIVVLLALGWVASALGFGNETTTDPKATPTIASTKGKQPMRWGNWELTSKIKAKKGFNGEYEPDFTVKNIGSEPDTGSFTVAFLKGKTVLGTANCTTAPSLAPSDLAPVMSVQCLGACRMTTSSGVGPKSPSGTPSTDAHRTDCLATPRGTGAEIPSDYRGHPDNRCRHSTYGVAADGPRTCDERGPTRLGWGLSLAHSDEGRREISRWTSVRTCVRTSVVQ